METHFYYFSEAVGAAARPKVDVPAHITFSRRSSKKLHRKYIDIVRNVTIPRVRNGVINVPEDDDVHQFLARHGSDKGLVGLVGGLACAFPGT